MRSSGVLVTWSLLAAVSCVLGPVELENRRCDDAHPCAVGFSCSDGFCRSSGGTAGGSSGGTAGGSSGGTAGGSSGGTAGGSSGGTAGGSSGGTAGGSSGGTAGSRGGGTAGGSSGGTAGGSSGGIPSDGGITHPAGTVVLRVGLFRSDSGVPDDPFGVAISSAGVVYVTTRSGQAYRGNLTTRAFEPPLGIAPGGVDVAFTKDERFVLVAHQNEFSGPITIIDATTNTIAGVVPTAYGLASIARDLRGDRTFFGMANTSDLYELRRVADGGFSGDAGIDGFIGRTIATTKGRVGTATFGLAWDDARETLYMTNSEGSLTPQFFFDGGTPRTDSGVAGYGLSPGVRGVVYDRFRDRLFMANETGNCFILQLPQFSVRPSPPPPTPRNWGIELTPDGDELWLTSIDAGALTILTISTEQIRVVTGLGRPRRIAFDATGLNAIVTNEAGEVLFFR